MVGCGGIGMASPQHQRQDMVSLVLLTGHSVGHGTVTQSCAFYFVLLVPSGSVHGKLIRSWTSASSNPLGKTEVLYQCPHV